MICQKYNSYQMEPRIKTAILYYEFPLVAILEGKSVFESIIVILKNLENLLHRVTEHKRWMDDVFCFYNIHKLGNSDILMYTYLGGK